jgi:S1-C subfamily serine protease
MIINVLAFVTFLAAIGDVPDRPTFIGVCVTLDRAASDVATSLTVRSVEPGSPAERANIAVGDRITAIAGKPVSIKEDVDLLVTMARLKAGQPITVSVDRGGKPLSITVTPMPMDDARASIFKKRVACLEDKTACNPQQWSFNPSLRRG